MGIPDKQLGQAIVLTPGSHTLNAASLRAAKFIIFRGNGEYAVTLANLSGQLKTITVVNETSDEVEIANRVIPSHTSVTIAFSGTVWF